LFRKTVHKQQTTDGMKVRISSPPLGWRCWGGVDDTKIACSRRTKGGWSKSDSIFIQNHVMVERSRCCGQTVVKRASYEWGGHKMRLFQENDVGGSCDIGRVAPFTTARHERMTDGDGKSYAIPVRIRNETSAIGKPCAERGERGTKKGLRRNKSFGPPIPRKLRF